MLHKINVIVIIGLLVVLALSGCVPQKHRELARDGILIVGMKKGAFLMEWGRPDIIIRKAPDYTYRAGEEGPFDIWIYQKQGLKLVFEGSSLIHWNKIE